MTELPEAPRPEELEPVAHVFQDDLHRLQTSECAVTAYSVAMGDPDRGETVPLILASQPAGEPVAEVVEQDTRYNANARGIKHLREVKHKDDLIPAGTKLYLHGPTLTEVGALEMTDKLMRKMQRAFDGACQCKDDGIEGEASSWRHQVFYAVRNWIAEGQK